MPLTKPHCGLHEPAHPHDEYYDEQRIGQSSGLTKREHFAGLALQGLIAAGEHRSYDVDAGSTLTWTGTAQEAVEAAEALIEALNRKDD